MRTKTKITTAVAGADEARALTDASVKAKNVKRVLQQVLKDVRSAAVKGQSAVECSCAFMVPGRPTEYLSDEETSELRRELRELGFGIFTKNSDMSPHQPVVGFSVCW